MQIFLNVVLMISGLALLIKGSDIFVDSSVNIARKLKVSPMLIGLTIVAFGTAAPEIVISTSSAIGGHSGLAMGNLIGSNIFNLIFILGLCSLIKPFNIEIKRFYKEFLFSILAVILVLAMLLTSEDYIPTLFSASLLIVFAIYMFLIIKQSSKTEASEEEFKDKPLYLSIILVLVGLLAIIFGSELVVNSAVFKAETFGVTDRVIGLTVIAAGTSLPELSISVLAFKKGRGDLAIGNIIGSNVFNILFIMGLTGSIAPLEVNPDLILDSLVLLIGSIITFVFLYTGKKLVRFEGAFLVAIYISYMLYTVFF